MHRRTASLHCKCSTACSTAGLEAWPRGTIQAEELWKMDSAEHRYIMGRDMCCPALPWCPQGRWVHRALEQNSSESTGRFMGLDD